MGKRTVGVLLVCLLLCHGGFVGAAEGDEFLPAYGGPEEPEGISPFRLLAQLLFSLALVIGLFYLLARFLKSRWSGSAATRYLLVMDRLSLGVNRDILIVRLGNQFLLLGVTGENISLLQVIDDPDLLLTLKEQETGESAFARLLSNQAEGRFLPLSILEAQLTGLKGRRKAGGESQQGKGQE